MSALENLNGKPVLAFSADVWSVFSSFVLVHELTIDSSQYFAVIVHGEISVRVIKHLQASKRTATVSKQILHDFPWNLPDHSVELVF